MNKENLLANPIEIKVALIRAKKTQAQIARKLGVSKVIVTHVIKNQRTSHRVRRAIAKAIGRRINELWPESNNKRKAA